MRRNDAVRRNRRVERLLSEYHQDDEVVFAEFYSEMADEDRKVDTEWTVEVIDDGRV
jgi:hypothetical protein